MASLINTARGGRIIVAAIEQADTFWRRSRGLLFRRGLAAGAGLWIVPCSSIHMFGMCFSLDVLFLDADLRVVKIVRKVRPFGMALGGPRAHSVVEIAAGWLPDDAVAIGDQLSWGVEPQVKSNGEKHR